MWLRSIKGLIAAITLLFSFPAFAQNQISADRPGIGSDADVVPLYTLQPEMGTYTKEIRFGIYKNTEIDKDDTSWGIKHNISSTDKLKLSLKASYDENLGWVIEVPTQHNINKYFYIGADAIISKTQKTYVAEFNITPTSRLTITNSLYYSGKPRLAIFAAWIPPKHDNVQFDVGFDQKKLIIGISTDIDFKKK